MGIENRQLRFASDFMSRRWQNLKDFYQYRNVRYSASMIAVAALSAAAISPFIPEPTAEGSRKIVLSSEEFQVSYDCVANRSPDSEGEKHVEITVISPSYRTSNDPADLLRIWLDKPNQLALFQDTSQLNPGRSSARVFKGDAVFSFEKRKPYEEGPQSQPRSHANFQIEIGSLADPNSIRSFEPFRVYETQGIPLRCD